MTSLSHRRTRIKVVESVYLRFSGTILGSVTVDSVVELELDGEEPGGDLRALLGGSEELDRVRSIRLGEEEDQEERKKMVVLTMTFTRRRRRRRSLLQQQLRSGRTRSISDRVVPLVGITMVDEGGQ
jgi:hypothetical protein